MLGLWWFVGMLVWGSTYVMFTRWCARRELAFVEVVTSVVFHPSIEMGQSAIALRGFLRNGCFTSCMDEPWFH